MGKVSTAPAAEAAADAKPSKPTIPTETFEAEVVVEGKKTMKVFKFRKALFIVPTIGKMTAEEALKNDVALAILVDNGASCIEEVVKEKKAKADKPE